MRGRSKENVRHGRFTSKCQTMSNWDDSRSTSQDPSPHLTIVFQSERCWPRLWLSTRTSKLMCLKFLAIHSEEGKFVCTSENCILNTRPSSDSLPLTAIRFHFSQLHFRRQIFGIPERKWESGLTQRRTPCSTEVRCTSSLLIIQLKHRCCSWRAIDQHRLEDDHNRASSCGTNTFVSLERATRSTKALSETNCAAL